MTADAFNETFALCHFSGRCLRRGGASMPPFRKMHRLAVDVPHLDEQQAVRRRVRDIAIVAGALPSPRRWPLPRGLGFAGVI
jgi:hypothetical protein